MPVSRRTILKTSPALVVGLAGCSGSRDEGGDSGSNDVSQDDEPLDSDNDGVPDVRDDYPNDSFRSERLYSTSDTRNIQEDEWYYYNLSFSQSGTVEYDFVVREGPAIDVIVMDESEYQYFGGEQRWEYYPGVSALDSTGENVSGSVSSGSYRLIFDNSSEGNAAPPANFSNDVATVEFTLETSQ